ncbi:MAG: sigma-70 family RNA polymerase sigma factor [Planctomycetales bacterium]|nr:sigma-70 family RNA polymerase sigma factor [Planctomycetales bacterium]
MTDDRQTGDQLHELLLRAVEGDESAYRTAFEVHRQALARLIELRLCTRLRRRVDPSDLVQETYLESLQRLPDFLVRQPMPFEVWIKRTARQQLARCYRDHAQTAKRSVTMEQPMPQQSSVLLAASLADPGSSPRQHLARQEYREAVCRAIEGLDAADRDLLLMRHVEDLAYREISQLLDIDEAAARKRYGRALVRLRQQLAAAGLRESCHGERGAS